MLVFRTLPNDFEQEMLEARRFRGHHNTPKHMIATPLSKTISSRDIRQLDLGEVSSLHEWLNRYMRLEFEDGRTTNSDLLLHVLVRSNREYESDLGVFGVEE
jgi:hypothetical protein